jgi:hypothetical protein
MIKEKDMHKLLVVPNFKKFRQYWDEEGLYVLILPYGVVNKKREALWVHFCSSKNFAMGDLKYPNRTKFLNEYFGEGNWEFEFYNFDTQKQLEEYCKEIAVICDLDKLDRQFKKYKKENIHL